jgi:hypothetical protein
VERRRQEAEGRRQKAEEAGSSEFNLQVVFYETKSKLKLEL